MDGLLQLQLRATPIGRCRGESPTLPDIIAETLFERCHAARYILGRWDRVRIETDQNIASGSRKSAIQGSWRYALRIRHDPDRQIGVAGLECLDDLTRGVS
jgi:hypothetical protein